jgi:hypothetical protein
MARVKLLTTGGYKGLEQAVGKNFNATKILGHWNILGADLEAAGCTPCMYDYAFLQREIEVVGCHTQGL